MERLPSSAGISPLNSLLWRTSSVRWERLPSSAGISPLNSLLWRSSTTRLERLPNSAGISPLKSLLWRYSSLRLERLPSSAGISPLKLLSSGTNAITRPSSLVVTPYHSPRGASLSQLLLSNQFSPSVAL